MGETKKRPISCLSFSTEIAVSGGETTKGKVHARFSVLFFFFFARLRKRRPTWMQMCRDVGVLLIRRAVMYGERIVGSSIRSNLHARRLCRNNVTA